MKKTINKLMLSLGTVAIATAPVVLAISCNDGGGSTDDGGLTSQTFATVQGDTESQIKGMLFSPLNPNNLEGVKNIAIQNAAILKSYEKPAGQAFPQDVVIDMSTVGSDEYTMTELEDKLRELNVQINTWLDTQFARLYPTGASAIQKEEFRQSFRYKWVLDADQETLTINFYMLPIIETTTNPSGTTDTTTGTTSGTTDTTSGTPAPVVDTTTLNYYVNNVFLNSTTGIKQVPVDQLIQPGTPGHAIPDGFQYFMGVRPLTYTYLHEGFHLDANFHDEADMLTKLQGHKFTSADQLPSNVHVDNVKFPHIEDVITFGPESDIFIVLVPHLDPDTEHEFYVNIEFYKGGTLTKDGFRTIVHDPEETFIKTLLLDGAYPKDSTTGDVSDWATDESNFRLALASTEALTTQSTMNMMGLVKTQMPEYSNAIDALKEAGNLMREKNLYDAPGFAQALYENTVTDREISVSEYMKFGANYTFDAGGIITAPGGTVKQLVVHVLMVYENHDFILDWNRQHPAPLTTIQVTNFLGRSHDEQVNRWPEPTTTP